ncbi:MAG TPA: DUF3293 domain-containing protein [Rhodanobacter sp.]
MDKALLDAFRATEYLVCLDELEVAPAHPAPALRVPPLGAPATLAHPWAAVAPARPAPATLAHPWAAWASIRIDQRLPEPLQLLVGAHSWGFITAWNPRSQAQALADNLAAQHALLAALRAWPEAAIHPAIGVGPDWREPSLFVIGPDLQTLDALGHRHQQNAYVHGHGNTVACLRLLRP